MTEEQIKHMVDRFLGWRLPEPWYPDNGISYQRPNYAHAPTDQDWPTGTNLFDADQAEAMVRYMLDGLPAVRPDPPPVSYLERLVTEREANKAIPVDRDNVTLTDGSPVPTDRSHTALKDNGQQKEYVVLSEAERAKGFVRPVRRSYRHLKCGTVTTMGQALAETYARDPYFYSGTFCCGCGRHFPVGDEGIGEFMWDDGSNEMVGT